MNADADAPKPTEDTNRSLVDGGSRQGAAGSDDDASADAQQDHRDSNQEPAPTDGTIDGGAAPQPDRPLSNDAATQSPVSDLACADHWAMQMQAHREMLQLGSAEGSVAAPPCLDCLSQAPRGTRTPACEPSYSCVERHCACPSCLEEPVESLPGGGWCECALSCFSTESLDCVEEWIDVANSQLTACADACREPQR